MRTNTPLIDRIRGSRLFWPFVVLGLILAFDAIFIPGFFKIGIVDGHLYGNLIDVLNNAAPLMLVAMGMTLVIATGGVDLSVGAVVAISAAAGMVLISPVFTYDMIKNKISPTEITNTSLWLAVLADLAAGMACGLWNGLLVSRGKISPVVATLILMVAGRGVAQIVSGGGMGIFIYYTPYFYFGNGFILGLPVSIYIVALVFLCAWVLVRKTSLGLFIAAVGANAESAEYSGIGVKNIQLFVYVFCGFCAAIAGLILGSYLHGLDANNIGLNYELDAILAVVLGGTLMTGGRFSLFASVLGALVIWLFTITMYTLGVPANALLAGRAVLVLVAIILYSDHARRFLNSALHPAR